MLKREITFTDFNGNEVTETHYFNLTKSELIELELSQSGGLEANMKAIVEARDVNTIMKEFKRIILMSYGQKTPDGKSFVKNDEIREAFLQTAAYDALFMEICSSDDAAVNFMKAVMPQDLAEEVAKEQAANKEKTLQDQVAEKLGITSDSKTTAEIAAEQA